MVGRETRVQAAAVVAAMVLWGAVSSGVGEASVTDPVVLAAGLGTYFLVLAGGHLYLGLRGDPGSIGVDARWRFAGATAVVLTLLGVAVLASDAPPVLRGLLVAVAGGVGVTWFVLEARVGYGQSLAGDD